MHRRLMTFSVANGISLMQMYHNRLFCTFVGTMHLHLERIRCVKCIGNAPYLCQTRSTKRHTTTRAGPYAETLKLPTISFCIPNFAKRNAYVAVSASCTWRRPSTRAQRTPAFTLAALWRTNVNHCPRQTHGPSSDAFGATAQSMLFTGRLQNTGRSPITISE